MAQRRKIEKNILRLRELHRELAYLGPLMRGSVVVQGSPNRVLFSLNKNGKTFLLYLGKSREAMARQYSKNYKRLLEIIEEMTILNMELLKDHVPMEKILPSLGERHG
jgi:hypothetical protein